MKPFKIQSSELSVDNVQTIIKLLRHGEAVIIPTETVYGIACSMDEKAFLNLYFLKNRELAKPLPVLVYNIEQIKKLCVNIPSDFWVFAEHFLPGPLTVVLKKNPSLDLSCLDKDTIAIRFSSHKVTQLIAQEYGEPLFLSSANLSGKAAAKDLQELEPELSEGVSAIIDAGPLPSVVPSTIISLVHAKPKLLRVGAIAPSDIESFMGWNFN
jgi:L-threonylcarbamoyladenylate synthase